jgi:hypothetical protein
MFLALLRIILMYNLFTGLFVNFLYTFVYYDSKNLE